MPSAGPSGIYLGFVLLSLLLLLLVIGAGLLVTLLLGWEPMIGLYSSWWAKIGLVGARACSAGIGAKALTSKIPDDLMTWCALAAIGAYAVWELCGIRGDHIKSKDQDNKLHDIVKLNKDILLRNSLLTALTEMVSHKKQRVCAALRQWAGKTPNQIDRVGSMRDGLDAKGHIQLILQQLAAFLERRMPSDQDTSKQNFRIGFYVQCGDAMEQMDSFDLRRKSRMFLKSYRIAASHYSLQCTKDPSCVVRCVREQKLLVVSDCEKELVQFFHDDQRIYLKSLFAYPIIGFGDHDGPTVAACVVVDTNVAGFFKEEDRDEIETYIEQFAVRLDLEIALLKLSNPPRRVSDAKLANGT